MIEPLPIGQSNQAINNVAANELAFLQKKQRFGENVIQGFLFLCGAISILTTVGIVFVLGRESWLFFGNPEVNIVEFVTGTVWQPAIGKFGIWPLLTSTLIISFIAMLVAIPLGLSAAIY